MSWTLVFAKQALKDAKLLASSNVKPQAEKLLKIVATNPYQNPPPYEKLRGDLVGYCSRRINIQHRLVYQVFEAERTVKIIRMWSHYE